MRIGKIIANSVTSGKTILKEDIGGLRHIPRDIKTGWKTGAKVAKEENQNIFKGVKTKSKSAIKEGVVPHLPGIIAGLFCVAIPMAGSMTGGFLLGKQLQKLIGKIAKHK